MLARIGYPPDWEMREKGDFELPDGAEFYHTPGHGYLMIDIRKLPAKVSEYDYIKGNYVFLEGDCSATMWMVDMGLIEKKGYMGSYWNEIERENVSLITN